MNIASFTFNDFQENTYVLWDTTMQGVIIDPGCNNASERTQLTNFIESNGITPVHLVNTHCHIDHVLGNKFVSDEYGLVLTSHQGEKENLYMQPHIAQMYGIPYDPSPEISVFLDEDDLLTFGNTSLKVLYTPGHSPASISLYEEESGILVAGDVLFKGSIGRTDLPGGDFDTLINNIKTKFFVLPDEVRVFSGHGPQTTIGEEKRTNPFF